MLFLLFSTSSADGRWPYFWHVFITFIFILHVFFTYFALFPLSSESVYICDRHSVQTPWRFGIVNGGNFKIPHFSLGLTFVLTP